MNYKTKVSLKLRPSASEKLIPWLQKLIRTWKKIKMNLIDKYFDYLLLPFAKWKDFNGSSNRREFWIGFLTLCLVSFLADTAALNFQPMATEIAKSLIGFLLGIFIIYCLICLSSLATRRLNDRGTRKRYLLLMPISGLALIVVNFVLPEFVIFFRIITKSIWFYFVYVFSSNRK